MTLNYYVRAKKFLKISTSFVVTNKKYDTRNDEPKPEWHF